MNKDYLVQVLYKNDLAFSIMTCVVRNCKNKQDAIYGVRKHLNEHKLQDPSISAITDVTGTEIVETGGKILCQ